ncbi:hypothetical protein A4A49_41123 [Nicotiana attenuata]|uniref:Uncharacterized protein n=1 Tax=Nicotiana attenuata TaxID=49451 RepID=A0A314L7G6_NICAT|nr:hypothetical protein A4A49_41123 [Nicotiana attenuata]
MMGNWSLNTTPIFTQSSKSKKHKNGKKHASDHHLHPPTTTGPPTGLLVGGCLVGARDFIRLHSGQQEGDADSAKFGTPSQSDSRSPEQGLSGIWPSPMAIDGQRRPSIADNRPTNSQQPHFPKFSIPSLLPRSDERRPSGRASIHPDRSTNHTLTINAKENEQITTTSEHSTRSLQSTGDTEEEGCHRGTGADLPNSKNGIDSARLVLYTNCMRILNEEIKN